MKYIVVLSDGMAGRPLKELGGKTTLEAAYVPEMDRLASMSEVGLVSMVPEGMAPGSDTANLAVMGYDPKVYYTGRSPLEALSIGVDMNPSDVSFRCNLVTLSEEDAAFEDQTIIDHSSDEITTEEAAALIETLKIRLKKDGYHLFAGTSYRHLLIQEKGKVTDLTPPHDILTKRIGDYLPEDPVLLDMMKKSYDILKEHPVNTRRRKNGLRPANCVWFWGAGKKPALDSFAERTGKKGVMISAVDLLKGIAVGAGMDTVEVEGANGGLHTNYRGKAQAAVRALAFEGYDFAYIHVEAPDEMGHQGSVEKKVKAIENIDEFVIGPLVEALKEKGEDFRMLILPDHPTPIRVRTHTADAVPYLLYDSAKEESHTWDYNEAEAKESGNYVAKGHEMIDVLFSR